jgi:ferritin-like metal-binding protein YciE
MAMQSTHELFIHELQDMYDAEHKISGILNQQIQETQDEEIKNRLATHLQETQKQTKNLEKCFQDLSESPQPSPCFAMDGIKKEHDAFLKENPSPDVLTLFNIGAANKVEFYEIASYEGLIDKSTVMGHNTCTRLLRENLDQEKAMAESLTLFSRTLEKDMAQPM